MSRLAWLFVVLVLVMLCVIFGSVHQANAGVDYEDPGFPWGDYRVTWRSADLQHYKLEYINSGMGYCEVEVRADCVEPELPAPAGGMICQRTGNQKFECSGAQTLRWTETIRQECFAFIPKLSKCPPCPVCESQGMSSPECVSCMGGGE